MFNTSFSIVYTKFSTKQYVGTGNMEQEVNLSPKALLYKKKDNTGHVIMCLSKKLPVLMSITFNR